MTASQILEKKGYDNAEQNDIVSYKLDGQTREHFSVFEPVHLWEAYYKGDADLEKLSEIAVQNGFETAEDLLSAMTYHLNNLAESYPSKSQD